MCVIMPHRPSLVPLGHHQLFSGRMQTWRQCGPQKLNNEGMYMVQNGSHTYLTNI